MTRGTNATARLVLAAASASVAACTLLVDTSGLSGDGAPDAGMTSADGAQGDGAAEAGLAPDGSLANPCSDPKTVFCERFDTAPAVSRYPSATDPSTRISFDDSVSVSPPGSAKFEIDPSANTSPDATLRLVATASLAQAVIEGWARIDRSETGQVGRLIAMNVGGHETVYVERSGAIKGAVTGLLGKVAAPPEGQWFRVRVELRADVVPPTVNVTLGSARSADLPVGAAAWSAGAVTVIIGISEANSPNTGWLVHWDDMRVSKL